MFLPGLGLIRKTVTLALCGVAFWAGFRLAEAGQPAACRDAGGQWDMRGFCLGATR